MASADASPTQSTINIPQLAVLLIVGFLAVRWIFSSSSSSTSQQPPGRATAASRGAGPRVNPNHVETLSQMFPQLNRREIMWDLQRNGGNVQATTERLLTGRGLETVSDVSAVATCGICVSNGDPFSCTAAADLSTHHRVNFTSQCAKQGSVVNCVETKAT
jgi:CUE domain